MRLERTKNAINNSVWGLSHNVVSLIMPFMVRTALIKTLGMEYLGLSSLFTSILSILNLSELGIGSAIVYSMYKPIADNDTDLICALMSLYRRIYRVIGIVILFIGALVVPFLPRFINGNIPENINIYVLYFIYLANVVISYWLYAYRNSLIAAHQRTDITSKVALITHFLMYSIQIIVLALFKNYYIYIIFMPLFNIVNNLVVAVCSKKMFPYYFCKGKVDSQVLDDIKKRVAGLAMNKIAYASRNAFDSVIVSSFLGLQLVAMYNNYYYIINAVAGLMRVFMSAILAGVGNSIETDTKEKNLHDLRTINFVYMSIACLGFACIINLYQPFMKIWVGEEYLFSSYIMISFAIYFLIEKAENVIGIYYDAAGLWWKGRWKGFIEAVLNLFLNIILCKLFGVWGVVLATIITMMFIGFFLTTHYVFKFYFQSSPKKFIEEQIELLIKFLIIGFIAFVVCINIPFGNTTIETLFLMALRLLATIVISVFLYWLLFKNNRQFFEASEWVKNHIAILRK